MNETVSVEYNFLLIGQADTGWPRILEKAVFPLGSLHTVPEDEAINAVAERSYDVVIIDASSVPYTAQLTHRLRVERPDTRVVVVTLSPTWRRARQALRAGASDYIYRYSDEKELRSRIMEVLGVPPRSRSD